MYTNLNRSVPGSSPGAPTTLIWIYIMKSCKGFTLIEPIIVIALIGILRTGLSAAFRSIPNATKRLNESIVMDGTATNIVE